MHNRYQEELDRIRLTDLSKERLVEAMKKDLAAPAAPVRKRARRLSTAAAAAVICIMVFSAVSVGAGWALPGLRELYHNSPGYQQSSVLLNDSVTEDGWTVTLTDCLLDEYNIYVGVTLTAPEGTVLDAPGGYFFADWRGIEIADAAIAGASHYEQVDDGCSGDGSISFVFRSYYLLDGHSLDGKTMRLSLNGLCHNEIDGSTQQTEQVYDCRGEWDFSSTVRLPERTIIIEPNVPVQTLGVEAIITKIEVTPLGAYVYIEGDSLKGHHDWVPLDASDGWYGCVDHQDVVLHMQDNVLSLDTGMNGSGCSGGDSAEEPGWLRLARRADTLIDIDAVDYITVCDVDIPLQ